MKLQLDSNIPKRWRWMNALLLRQMARSYESYHPVIVAGKRIARGERACLDRWNMIEAVIRRFDGETLLDLGCAEGYFVQQAALRCGCTALGIDADKRRLMIAQNSSILNETVGAGFLLAHITPEFLESAPESDIVLLLSVLHHIMYEHGYDYAHGLMQNIRRKTRKALIFDMGQSDEVTHEWAALLPPMLPDPATWIAGFLRSSGFSHVEPIGSSDAYKSSARRVLFVATP